MSTLIKNGRIITAEQDYIADILVEDEKVSMIGKDLKIEADTVIDAKDKYVIPGGVDVHTHLDMPFGGTTSSDDFESGTKAAAFGGTTCLIDFAIQAKGTRMRDGLDIWWGKAEGKAAIEEYNNNEVTLRVETAGPALVILTDCYYPGWNVSVDGVRKPMLRANSIFRAVEVSPGAHTVVFRYQPHSFRWGAALSVGTILVAFAGLFGEQRFTRHRSRRDSAGILENSKSNFNGKEAS